MARCTTETSASADMFAFGPGRIITPDGQEADAWVASVKGSKKTPGRKTGILEVEYGNGETRTYRLQGEGGMAAGIASGQFKIEGHEIKLSGEAKRAFKQKLEELGAKSALHRQKYLED